MSLLPSSPETTDAAPEKVVTVYNRGTNKYVHGTYVLLPGNFIDVPKSVAEVLCSCNEAGSPAVVLADSMKANSNVSVNQQQAAVVAELEKTRATSAAKDDLIAKQAAELAGLQKLLEGLTKPATADVQVAPPSQ